MNAPDEDSHPACCCTRNEGTVIRINLGWFFGFIILGCAIIVAALIAYAPDVGVPLGLEILAFVKAVCFVIFYGIVGLIICVLIFIALCLIYSYLLDR